MILFGEYGEAISKLKKNLKMKEYITKSDNDFINEALTWSFVQRCRDEIKDILPSHYEVINCFPSAKCIRCKSKIGLRISENDDHEQWYYIENTIKKILKEDLIEISFNTNAYYQDFNVYVNTD